MSTMKPRRQGMIWTGWALTVIGMGVVLFWTGFEAVHSFVAAPLATILGVLIVLAVLGFVMNLAITQLEKKLTPWLHA